MNLFVRLILGGILAAIITPALLLLMYTLINTEEAKVKESPSQKIADIFMPETKIEAKRYERKPDKPEEPEAPPPETVSPSMDDLNVQMDAVATMSPVAAKIDINTSTGLNSADGEYLPMNKVQPDYPRRALSRGIQGYCTVEYTVTKTGATRDVKVVDCPKSIFARNSIKAAERFKYKPRIVDGEAVPVAGVRNKFTFRLED